MNTALKHWREAATLILAAGHKLAPDSVLTKTPVSAAVVPPLNSTRTQGHLLHKSRFDYQVLVLKRSGKSGFMPNAYVFPGGMVDSSDFSSDWLDVFKPFSNLTNFGLRNVKQSFESRPPIFATDRLKLGSEVPGEVGLRICALRETFEESGVLLVVSKKDESSLLKSIEDPREGEHHRGHELDQAELTKWRSLVNKHPSNFVKMCKELEVLPNIWALHEWANWLTPTAKYANRFDTAFFMCCLQDVPHTLQDAREIERFQWSTPSEIIQSYQTRQIWIAPPQFYELSRMCHFPSLTDLHYFAHRRATEGCEQWMPVIVAAEEHHVSLLPGDQMYPPDALGESGNFKDSPSKDPQKESALHRIVMPDPYTTIIQITITPKYNHLHPVLALASSNKPEREEVKTLQDSHLLTFGGLLQFPLWLVND